MDLQRYEATAISVLELQHVVQPNNLLPGPAWNPKIVHFVRPFPNAKIML
jgi:hypothetical protein